MSPTFNPCHESDKFGNLEPFYPGGKKYKQQPIFVPVRRKPRVFTTTFSNGYAKENLVVKWESSPFTLFKIQYISKKN